MTVLKKIGLRVLYFISTVGFWVLTYFGTIKHVPWAWNLFAFLVWLSFVLMSICILALSTEQGDQIRDSVQANNTIPPIIRRVEGYLMACFVAALGHWFYAIIVFLDMLLTDMLISPKTVDKSKAL